MIEVPSLNDKSTKPQCFNYQASMMGGGAPFRAVYSAIPGCLFRNSGLFILPFRAVYSAFPGCGSNVIKVHIMALLCILTYRSSHEGGSQLPKHYGRVCVTLRGEYPNSYATQE